MRLYPYALRTFDDQRLAGKHRMEYEGAVQRCLGHLTKRPDALTDRSLLT